MRDLRVGPKGRKSFRTIGAALAAARPGSRIVISPGQYVEAVRVRMPVTLVADGAGVSIDFRGDSAFGVDNAEVTAEGLTIRNWGPDFGAAFARNGQLNLVQCRIIGSEATAVVAIGSTLTADGCDIRSAGGSGLSAKAGSHVTLRSTAVTQCSTNGVYAEDSSVVLQSVQLNDCAGNALKLVRSHVDGVSSTFSDCHQFPLIYAERSQGELKSVVLEEAGRGVEVVSGQLNFSDSVIRNITGNAIKCLDPGTVTLRDVILEGPGSGVAGEGGAVNLEDVTITVATCAVYASGTSRIRGKKVAISGAKFGLRAAGSGQIGLSEVTIDSCSSHGILSEGTGTVSISALQADSGDTDRPLVSVSSGNVHLTGSDLRGGIGNIIATSGGEVYLRGGTVLGSGGHYSGLFVGDAGRLQARDVKVVNAFAGVTGGLLKIADVTMDNGPTGATLWARGSDATVIVESSTIVNGKGRPLLLQRSAKAQIHGLTIEGCKKAPVVSDDCSLDTSDVTVDGDDWPPEHKITAQVADGSNPAATPPPSDATSAQNIDDSLKSLVGLAAVKADVADMRAFMELEQRQREAGLDPPPVGRHLVFSGPPGTGKTTVARLYGKLLVDMGLLSKGHLVEVSRSDLVSSNIGGTAERTSARFKEARGGVLFIDEAYSLFPKDAHQRDFGTEAITTLVKLMEDHRDDTVVIAAGYGPEMAAFLQANPGLESRFTATMHFDAYTVDELVEVFQRMVTSQHLVADGDVLEAVRQRLLGMDRGSTFGNAREIRAMLERARHRMARRLAGGMGDDSDDLVTLLAADIADEATERRQSTPEAESVADIRAELDSMVGLSGVKAQVADLIDLLTLQQRQQDLGMTVDAVVPHLVFSGRPGTGKTTVARLYGRILAVLGVLRSGQVVETDRSGLVAGYIGQTATMTGRKFAEASGGILFIDEAYSLTSNYERDFGIEAIQALVKLMEDNRGDTVVIAAGYGPEMKQFLQANPGLASRFPRTVVFDDYDNDELVEIFDGIARSKGMSVAEAARTILRKRFEVERVKPGFGNGRTARNLYEDSLTAMARRVASLGTEASASDLTMLTESDVSAP